MWEYLCPGLGSTISFIIVISSLAIILIILSFSINLKKIYKWSWKPTFYFEWIPLFIVLALIWTIIWLPLRHYDVHKNEPRYPTVEIDGKIIPCKPGIYGNVKITRGERSGEIFISTVKRK